MALSRRFTFGKEERMHRKKDVDGLFGGEGRSLTSSPLRAVYMVSHRGDERPRLQVLVSVPKRHFHHAVDRNRLKRLIREAYRKNKHILLDALIDTPDQKIDLAFIWIEDQLYDYQRVEKSVVNALQRIKETL